MPNQKNIDANTGLKNYLGIPGNFVAIKMLTDPAGFENLKRPRKKLTLCQHLGQAYYLGRPVMLQAGDIGCYACDSILGFGDMPKEAWKRYTGWMTANDEVGRSLFQEVPKLPRDKFTSAAITTLQNCPVEPDVVVFAGNAAQMSTVIQAYLVTKGESLTFKSIGMTTCATVVAAPINDQKPSIAVTGNAPRILAFPSDTDLLCGIPGSLIEELVANMEFMRNRGATRYPPAWQHIGGEPQPPIADLLAFDGSPTWLK